MEKSSDQGGNSNGFMHYETRRKHAKHKPPPPRQA